MRYDKFLDPKTKTPLKISKDKINLITNKKI